MLGLQPTQKPAFNKQPLERIPNPTPIPAQYRTGKTLDQKKQVGQGGGGDGRLRYHNNPPFNITHLSNKRQERTRIWRLKRTAKNLNLKTVANVCIIQAMPMVGVADIQGVNG